MISKSELHCLAALLLDADIFISELYIVATDERIAILILNLMKQE
jgi:hypothetical protein